MNRSGGDIRIGTISSIDEEKSTARVIMEDRGNLVSYDYPICVPSTLEDMVYRMPAPGEKVLCALLSNNVSQGFILGSYYSDIREPPVKDRNKFHIQFYDGTILEYDRQEHGLTVSIPEAGDMSIAVDVAGDVRVRTEGSLQVEAALDIEVLSEQDITVRSAGSVSIEAAENISIDAEGEVAVSISGSAGIAVQGSARIGCQENVSVQAGGEVEISADRDITVQSRGSLILSGRTDTLIL